MTLSRPPLAVVCNPPTPHPLPSYAAQVTAAQPVLCLVRDPSPTVGGGPAAALARARSALAASFHKYHWGGRSRSQTAELAASLAAAPSATSACGAAGRLQVVCGNLSAPRFGLSDGDWHALAIQVAARAPCSFF